METGQILKLACNMCGNVGFVDGSDGYYYCKQCGSQAEDVIETGVADEDFMAKGAGIGTALYQTSHTRQITNSQPASQFVPLSQQSSFWSTLFQEPTTPNVNYDHQDIYTVQKKDNYNDVGVGLGPIEPADFGLGSGRGESEVRYEDYHFEVRVKYVMGVQLMIQLQCKALVEKFKVCPLICGVAGSIWLRFVASRGVLDEGWADKAINESESQKQEESEDIKPSGRYSQEPHNLHGQRAVMIWYKFLRKKIPLSSSLAICFLACHVVREAILPTDIIKWSIEGKLPYFTAYVDIEKRFGQPSEACNINTSLMFRPSNAVPLQKLESLAAHVAESIGLLLPPVNFYAIASRFLKDLSLPIENILPRALKIHEWSMPPDLWLSSNELRLPTRVCVMSVLIAAIRILYNINGFGAWEKSLSKRNSSSSMSNQAGRLDPECSFKKRDDDDELSWKNSSCFKKSELDAEELLCHLEARYKDISDTYEYSKDLPTYLQYCKDVVFAGLEPPHDDHEETRMIEQFWNFYQNEKFQETEPAEGSGVRYGDALNQKRSRDVESPDNHLRENKKIRDKWCGGGGLSTDNMSFHGEDCQHQGLNDDDALESSQGYPNSEADDEASTEALIERAIKRLKLDMEENRFCYMPPRIHIKRHEYLHYVRKKDEGSLTYVAHADYYILLRACARVAKIDIRIMHMGVMSFERRLAWLENRINHCLHLSPPSVTCEFCSEFHEDVNDPIYALLTDDPIGLSNLSI